MRAKTLRRQLVALGYAPFTPTDEQRFQVRVLAFNGVSTERIASILEMAEIELLYHFKRELELGEDVILAKAAATVMELSQQRNDLGVALRAAHAMLSARSARWREPKPQDPTDAGKPLELMSLSEVDRAIADLERRRRDPAAAADAQAESADE
ncbi:MAG: hypothetical protein ABWZ01_07240 [Methyloceanibacter sp.]